MRIGRDNCLTGDFVHAGKGVRCSLKKLIALGVAQMRDAAFRLIRTRRPEGASVREKHAICAAKLFPMSAACRFKRRHVSSTHNIGGIRVFGYHCVSSEAVLVRWSCSLDILFAMTFQIQHNVLSQHVAAADPGEFAHHYDNGVVQTWLLELGMSTCSAPTGLCNMYRLVASMHVQRGLTNLFLCRHVLTARTILVENPCQT